MRESFRSVAKNGQLRVLMANEASTVVLMRCNGALDEEIPCGGCRSLGKADFNCFTRRSVFVRMLMNSASRSSGNAAAGSASFPFAYPTTR